MKRREFFRNLLIGSAVVAVTPRLLRQPEVEGIDCALIVPSRYMLKDECRINSRALTILAGDKHGKLEYVRVTT